MKNALQLLIEELEKERKGLKECIQGCIDREEYGDAEWYQKSLFKIERELNILEHLDEPNLSEIRWLKTIEDSEKRRLDRADKNSRFFAYQRQRVNEARNQRIELEAKRNDCHIDGEQLLICLEDLLANKLPLFELIFPKRQTVILIERASNLLSIKIYKENDEAFKRNLLRYNLQTLHHLGFSINKKIAIWQTSDIKQYSIQDLHELIACAVLKGCAILGNQEAFIRYQETTN